jgi:hypothetical protein
MQLIRRVQPAARQRFTGGKGQIRFGKPFRFLQLFSSMETTHHVGFKRIKEWCWADQLNQAPITALFEKHRQEPTSAAMVLV